MTPLFASGTIADATPFMEFDWRFFDRSYRVRTRLVGEYNFDNAIAAVAVCKFFGIDAANISSALEEYEPSNHRSQFRRTDRNDLIIDAYNANPTSMEASVGFFSTIPTSLPKMVILGEMKELGEVSDRAHEKVVEYLKKVSFDKVFLVGEAYHQWGTSSDGFRYFDNVEELNKQLQDEPVSNHYILLKGSHSVHLEEAIPYL